MLNFEDVFDDTLVPSLTDFEELDDASDTQRFLCPDFDDPTDPEGTSIYDLGTIAVPYSAGRRRQIRAVRQEIAGLREALAAGWDVGPELAYEQRCLAALEDRANFE